MFYQINQLYIRLYVSFMVSIYRLLLYFTVAKALACTEFKWVFNFNSTFFINFFINDYKEVLKYFTATVHYLLTSTSFLEGKLIEPALF